MYCMITVKKRKGTTWAPQNPSAVGGWWSCPLLTLRAPRPPPLWWCLRGAPAAVVVGGGAPLLTLPAVVTLRGVLVPIVAVVLVVCHRRLFGLVHSNKQIDSCPKFGC